MDGGIVIAVVPVVTAADAAGGGTGLVALVALAEPRGEFVVDSVVVVVVVEGLRGVEAGEEEGSLFGIEEEEDSLSGREEE